jgi:hypothetical protein
MAPVGPKVDIAQDHQVYGTAQRFLCIHVLEARPPR